MNKDQKVNDCYHFSGSFVLVSCRVIFWQSISPGILASLYKSKSLIGAVHKRRPQSGGGSLSSSDIFGQGGRDSSNAGFRTFQFKKLSFLKFPHGQGGRAIADKVKGSVFSRFCTDVLYGRPLMVIMLKLN